MSIFQNSILSKASSFGSAIALLDRSSGTSVPYSRLGEFLKERLVGVHFDPSRPFSTQAESTFSHATLLLALLARNVAVAPLSHRLPSDEALRRAAQIGGSGLWRECGFVPLASVNESLTHLGSETLLFTSGSTGTPRAVIHGLESHLANAQGAASNIPLGPGCGWLLNLPLNHVSGFSILVRCLLAGATVVFPDSASSLSHQINDPSVTHLSVVGVQLRRLLADRAPLARLHAVLLGGGPVDERLVAEALGANVPLHLTYGMTETASQICTTGRLKFQPAHIHSGRPLPQREVRISSEGEIQVRGAILPRCIVNDGAMEKCVDEDGWFSTGDLGFFDSEGHLVVTGRRNRMFISGGENICPEVVENLLGSMPGIDRVVVVAVPDIKFGARPVAFVAGNVTPDAMRAFLKSRLEGFHVPDAFLPWPLEVSVDVPKPDFAYFSRLARARTV